GKLIVDAIAKLDPSKPVTYLPRLGSVVAYLREVARPGDLILTLGAGDIHRAGERFLSLD
ncbi:MAG: UDP-N-acetylmuramate--L-alanine ligase, partial [Thermoleophilia bacterium]|nr:UDP-N-acetylmuramate--L-alanine ligase [Thermoleophilia bacterium]